MNKEPYTRIKFVITEFQDEDILTGSDIVEIDPGKSGGGVIGEPENVILNR